MKKPGRPTKFNRVVADVILDVLRRGGTYRMAAQAAGVSDVTLERWRQTKPTFATEVERASAEGALAALDTIRAAITAGDWRAAAWLLEHRYPQDYGRQVVDASVSGAMTIRIIDDSADADVDPFAP